MSDDKVKEPSPAFAGNNLEETVPVPVPETVVLPQNPPAVQAEVRDTGLSVESESKSGSPGVDKIENESESGAMAALDVQASQAQAHSWPEEEEIYAFLHMYKTSGEPVTKERTQNSLMLGILNIPAMVTRNILRNFLAPFQEVIDEIKIIKDATPSRYMALIRFNAADIVDTFYTVYSGCSFTEKETDSCQMVYVEKFEILKSGGRASFLMQNLIELPLCGICLQRTGKSMRGMLTWLCDQSIEGQNSQYGLLCPVCTYYSMPEKEEPQCLVCGSREALHICLICGFIGCGQNGAGHAKMHFSKTKHSYGMQLSDQKVWDYTEDNYVDSDVDRSCSNIVQYRKEANEDNASSTQPDFSYLLFKELETQHFFWEQKITQVEKEASDEINNLKTRLRATTEKCTKLEYAVYHLLKERQAVEEKFIQLTTRLCFISIQLKEEQEKNKAVKANQIFMQQQLQEEDKLLTQICKQIDMKITDIQKQLQYIILYLQEQEKASHLAAGTTEDPQDPQEGQSNVSMDAPESLPREEDQ